MAHVGVLKDYGEEVQAHEPKQCGGLRDCRAVDGVFTGSTQVAKIINRALAAKDSAIVPLIAETGGIHAMVVDSSALPGPSKSGVGPGGTCIRSFSGDPYRHMPVPYGESGSGKRSVAPDSAFG